MALRIKTREVVTEIESASLATQICPITLIIGLFTVPFFGCITTYTENSNWYNSPKIDCELRQNHARLTSFKYMTTLPAFIKLSFQVFATFWAVPIGVYGFLIFQLKR